MHITAVRRHSILLRICLSLVALTILLLIAAGALAGAAIRTGHMAPPQGVVQLGSATLSARVYDCPGFPRCIGHEGLGDSTPVPYQEMFHYMIIVDMPSLQGKPAYTLADIRVEGTVVGLVTPDY